MAAPIQVYKYSQWIALVKGGCLVYETQRVSDFLCRNSRMTSVSQVKSKEGIPSASRRED